LVFNAARHIFLHITFITYPQIVNVILITPDCRDGSILFIGNLAWESPVEKLIEKLSPCAGFSGVSIARHEDTGRSKGWALATFENYEQVTAAINALNHSIIDERKIYMRHNMDLQDHNPTFNIYIGNLSFRSFTHVQLDALMDGYGSYFHHIQAKSGR